LKGYEQDTEITTNRLILRRFRKDDLDTYAKIMGDREVGKWFPKGDGYTHEESEKSLDTILKHWSKHGFGIWAIINKTNGALIGRCGLNHIDETLEVEVDFVLAPNSWGRGYATEAAKASLDYGFQKLKLQNIIALVKPENTASRRVIEKIGMQFKRNAEYWGITCAYYAISKAYYEEISRLKERF
jgi:ribosomal-protein-alanine N-acetyltransferase